MFKSNRSATSSKVVRVALFGEISPKQLQALVDAGCELHSTDAPGDSIVRAGCHAAGHKLLVHSAAWDVLDHPSSRLQVKFNDDGSSREFNANGGFTRDMILAGNCAGIILGTGVLPSRRQAILAAAATAGVTVRETVPVAIVEYATPVEAAETLAAIKL